MKIEKLCNVLRILKGLDPVPENFNRDEANRKVIGSMQAFFDYNKVNAKIQANENSWGASTNIAEINKQAYNFIMESAENDDLWNKAFTEVPVAEGQNGWEVHTGKSGIAFVVRQEGEKLDVQSISSTKVTAYFAKHGAAIGIYDEMIRFRQLAKMFDLLTEARNAYLIGKSTVFYNLLKAAVGTNITTWQGVAADGETRRDIITLRTAVNALGNRMKVKVPNASNGAILLYANPDDEDRIEAVFKAKTAEMAAALGKNAEAPKRSITRLYSYYITAGSPILIWPGRKNQKCELMGLTQLTAQDILTYAYIQAYWTYFGGVCADTDQFQQFILG